jgi:hypothetical protein
MGQRFDDERPWSLRPTLGTLALPRCGEQSVNDPLPNTRHQEVLSGITAKAVNNQRTNSSRTPGNSGVWSELQTRRTHESRHLH